MLMSFGAVLLPLDAREWFLSCVHTQVMNEVGALHEVLPALASGEWLLCVQAQMLCELGALCEALSTPTRREWLLPYVHTQVPCECRAIRKALSTLWPGECFSRVHA